jgi:hypothetical protein
MLLDDYHRNDSDSGDDEEAAPGDGIEAMNPDEDMPEFDDEEGLFRRMRAEGRLALLDEPDDDFEAAPPGRPGRPDAIMEDLQVNLTEAEEQTVRELVASTDFDINTVVQVFDACNRDREMTRACLQSMH